ncbi:unnamed protein product [Polarella glacialis]|uniref:EF-hand domain-containing protein n=1 Tax=Polarella glacialis TaxID=89957 RepID=A0A813J300_POLGL|nr:unnamed protein product [Polarella glacialis]
MSDKFQKLLGELNVQYMMDVQELRDEVILLKSDNHCFSVTRESPKSASQDSGALEGQTTVQQHRSSSKNSSKQQHKQPYKSDNIYRSEGSRWTYHQSYAGMSKEDIKLARLHRTLNQLDPMRHLSLDDDEILAAEVHHCTRIANFLQSDAYELLVGFVILMNVLVMAAGLQAQGTELGYSLGYPGYSEPSSGWQVASEVFAGLDFLFLSLFTVDLILRSSVLRIRFFQALLNWVDLLVVIGGLIEVFGHGFVDPFFLRMLRLMKFGRAFRAMQLSKISHSLKILGKCITASVGMLFWSLCLLFVIQCIGGMMLSILVRPFMDDAEIDPQVRRLVFRYYGTFSGSMLTMFEVLFANWSTACRILVDNVSEWFGLWFIIYRCLVGFAVLNVVNACFVQQTMSVAQQDTELMIEEKDKAKNAYARKLHILFRELDASGDGLVSWDEFAVLLTDDRLRSFLSAMGIDASDLQGLFEILGDGSGNISSDDFLVGAKRINGTAKAVDMAQLLSIVKRLDSKLETNTTSSQLLVLQAELAAATSRSNNDNDNHKNYNNNNNNSVDTESRNTSKSSALIAEGDTLDRLRLPFGSTRKEVSTGQSLHAQL